MHGTRLDGDAEKRRAAGLADLRARFGDRFQAGEAIRSQHANTTTYIRPQLPDAVIFAESEADVQAVVIAAGEHGLPIIPFGTGSSLEGHVNAPFGGISLDLSRMDRVLSVNADDLDCTVEPGITREALNTYLRDTGLFFPIDPGANASIGGMTSTRASGTNAVRYGTMKDNVLSVTAVTSGGRIVRTARRARKSSAGYDLTRLFVGAEGTLGVITAVTLKLYGIPEAIGGGVCAFPSVGDACKAVILTIQSGIPVPASSFWTHAGSGQQCLFRPDAAETATLFVEFHGSPEVVALQMRQFSELPPNSAGPIFAPRRMRRARGSVEGAPQRLLGTKEPPARCRHPFHRCLRADLASGRLRDGDAGRHCRERLPRADRRPCRRRELSCRPDLR